ncbi:MAG: CGGC domain-containing protein [Bacteroidales bacterium]|nr:CGGC domain-containing protein [Bacteroidales bacterium]
MKTTKIGIIICDRYHTCGGGKCFKSLKNREGAFSIYSKEEELEIVGYSTCGSCPGGNIEYVPDEMIKNGAEVIHLATGLIVGYPPCPRITQFKEFIEEKYKVKVVYGTHPIPQKYFETHSDLGTWKSEKWAKIIEPTLSNKETRLSYN